MPVDTFTGLHRRPTGEIFIILRKIEVCMSKLVREILKEIYFDRAQPEYVLSKSFTLGLCVLERLPVGIQSKK